MCVCHSCCVTTSCLMMRTVIMYLLRRRVTQGILLSPVGVNLYIWLCVYDYNWVVCFLCTCGQSFVAPPQYTTVHYIYCGNQW